MDRNLLENRVHGDAVFPLSVYRVEISGDHLFPLHWHNELEFDLVIEGRVAFQIDAADLEAATGQALFINNRELHAAYPAINGPCALYALVFDANLLAGTGYDHLQERFIAPILRKEYRLSPLILDADDWQQELLAQLSEVIALNETRPFAYELLIKARLYTMIALLLAHADPRPCRKNDSRSQEQLRRIKSILEYIQTHYSQKITTKTLAAIANVSEAHFCRFFKQMTRKTPVEYINYYRIQKAALLLSNSHQKITDVAMDAGFDNFSYFIRTFKHYMKVTPSAYRKRHDASPARNTPDSSGL